MDNFMPIVLANFKFKIISKIIDDMLATIMPYWFPRNKWVLFMVGI